MRIFLASGNAHKAAEFQTLADASRAGARSGEGLSPKLEAGAPVAAVYDRRNDPVGQVGDFAQNGGHRPPLQNTVRDFTGAGWPSPLRVEIVPASAAGGMPPVIEDAGTFEGNARKKALALRARLPADAWTLADDSGLCVEALAGAPGVESAYYAGPQGDSAANLRKLVAAMRDVPEAARRAHFMCVLLLAGPGGAEQVFAGRCDGRLLYAPRGGSGFGYDPLFVPDGYTESFAELGETVKNSLSHRGRAWAQLALWIEGQLR